MLSSKWRWPDHFIAFRLFKISIVSYAFIICYITKQSLLRILPLNQTCLPAFNPFNRIKLSKTRIIENKPLLYTNFQALHTDIFLINHLHHRIQSNILHWHLLITINFRFNQVFHHIKWWNYFMSIIISSSLVLHTLNKLWDTGIYYIFY